MTGKDELVPDYIDKAAEAIWLAEPPTSGITTRAWTENYPTPQTKDEYRTKALAAIDALELHQQRGRTRCSDPQCGDSTWDHDCDARPRRRLAGPWVDL